MKRMTRPLFALFLSALALGLLAAALPGQNADPADDSSDAKLGAGPAYQTLAKLPVMHQGRIKPLDTLARFSVKQIFGRETIRLDDQTWSPVAALMNWSIEPEFWDEQPIILVEYLPLKRILLAGPIEKVVEACLQADLDSAQRAQLEALKDLETVRGGDLTAAAEIDAITEAQRKELLRLADLLGEASHHLSPRFLEEVQFRLPDSGDTPVGFLQWHRDAVMRINRSESEAFEDAEPISDLDRKVRDVGNRLLTYQALRLRDGSDEVVRNSFGAADRAFLLIPRPSGEAYLKYTAEALATEPIEQTLLQADVYRRLAEYAEDVPREDLREPGTDAEFDEQFSTWLAFNSAWIPLNAVLLTEPSELARIGFDPEDALAFQDAFRAYEDAELESPGRVDNAVTERLVETARRLGEQTKHYPSRAEIEREVTFNALSPFFLAFLSYGAGLLVLSLSTLPRSMASSSQSIMGRLASSLYGLGLLGLASGIAMEMVGFYFRVRITGWAPVTNMYETVIWVALVSAIIGLIMELRTRKTYAALAGAGIAGLCTMLAANVPLLSNDGEIRTLVPVLRSNTWLLIHVLTIVSSYAAFALGMGLGLIGTFFYLTTNYRRPVSMLSAWRIAVVGLPITAVGGGLWLAATSQNLPPVLRSEALTLGYSLVGCLGVMFLGAVPLFWLGELLSRLVYTSRYSDQLSTIAMIPNPEEQVDAESKLRYEVMNTTASKIKPIADFVYRALQIGVLLVTAGTILGGVWADYSWGRFWGWDPKEVWALITLLVYLVPLHGRFAGWIDNFRLVAASVFCFSSVLMAWYGVNFVLGVGLHSYGFVEGGGQYIVFLAASLVASFPVAAAYRRHLGRRAVA